MAFAQGSLALFIFSVFLSKSKVSNKRSSWMRNFEGNSNTIVKAHVEDENLDGLKTCT